MKCLFTLLVAAMTEWLMQSTRHGKRGLFGFTGKAWQQGREAAAEVCYIRGQEADRVDCCAQPAFSVLFSPRSYCIPVPQALAVGLPTSVDPV